LEQYSVVADWFRDSRGLLSSYPDMQGYALLSSLLVCIEMKRQEAVDKFPKTASRKTF
jgi:hypothetical protein